MDRMVAKINLFWILFLHRVNALSFDDVSLWFNRCNLFRFSHIYWTRWNMFLELNEGKPFKNDDYCLHCWPENLTRLRTDVQQQDSSPSTIFRRLILQWNEMANNFFRHPNSSSAFPKRDIFNFVHCKN